MSWLMKISDMPSAFTSRVDQRDDLGLDDRVERAGRLVGDQQFRAGGDGRGNGDALALAAGKLVRVGGARAWPGRAIGRVRSARQPCRAQRRDRSRGVPGLPRRSARRPCMTGSRLAPGSWKTKPMSRPLQRRPAEARPVDLPGDLRRAGQQAGNRQRQRALARAAFADHRQPLALAEIEARCRRARRRRCRR